MKVLLRLVLAGLALLVGACDSEPETIVEEAEEEGFEELLVGEPFEGTAPVDDIVSLQAFLLLDTLVLTDAALDVEEGDLVEVTGTVHDDLAAATEALGVDPEDVDEHDGDLFVVAETVEVVR